MSFDPRQISRADELKALAHPVRVEILESLTLDGPQTASQVGERLDETAANCSYHLRTLAKFGFVRESGGGTGRERPWEIGQVGMRWGGAEPDTAERMAGDLLSQRLIEREMALFDRAREEITDANWRDVSGLSQNTVWLTREEADEVQEQIVQLLEKRLERLSDPSTRPAGSRLVRVVALLTVDPTRDAT